MRTRLLGLFLVAIMGISCGLPQKMPKGKNIQIRIELDSSISNCEQKVYLHHYNHDDRIIDDSASIKKGQKEIYLYASCEQEHSYSILFSKRGPIDWFLILTPNCYVEASISEDDGISPIKQVKGSFAMNERVQNVLVSANFNREKRELYAALSSPKLTDEESKHITARVAGINAQLDSIQMNVVRKSLSPLNTVSSLRYFKGKVSRDSLISLCNIAKIRFPDNKEIERLVCPVHINYPPESEESKIADKLIKDIMEKRMMEFAKFKKANQKEKTVVDINTITLFSDKNDKISVSQIKGKVILIDFWASWCIPCLEEIPYVRQLQKLYEDNITICLISIDKKHNNWKKSIEKNHLHDFINLTAVDGEGNMNKTIQEMNVGSIPYNIILNERHEIIAKNIHGKELLQKIDNLMKR